MHIGTFTRPIEISGQVLDVGVPYLLEKNAISPCDSRLGELSAWENDRPFGESHNWNGKKILVIRNGGFGDLLMLTPLLAEIKLRWQNCEITVCSGQEYGQILDGNEDISHRIAYPISLKDSRQFEGILEFEETAKFQRLEKSVHTVDLFAGVAGISVRDRRTKLVVAVERLRAARERYPRRSHVRRIGVQAAAESIVRSYPPNLLLELLDILLSRGHEVFLFGHKEQFPSGINPSVVMFSGGSLRSFSDHVALLTTCDACVAPDSSFCHVAGALNIPVVALYGPFPASLRTSYYSSVSILSGSADCAPCFHHTRGGRVFPLGGPCEKSGRCEALAGILPATIASSLESILSCLS